MGGTASVYILCLREPSLKREADRQDLGESDWDSCEMLRPRIWERSGQYFEGRIKGREASSICSLEKTAITGRNLAHTGVLHVARLLPVITE